MTTTLLLGGRVYSAAMPDATAMAVRDGTVIWLGSDDVGRALHPGAEIVDLDGGFVAPAFVDAHVHLTATGLLLDGLDLGAARSAEHCLRLIAQYADAHPGDAVLWGHGWDDTDWPDGAPDTAALDAVVGDRPAYLSRTDVHSAMASRALRHLAGPPTPLEGAPVTADDHHRVRTTARGLLTAAQRDRARRTALDAAAAAGVVAVHECAGPQIGGLQDWREVAAVDHGVEVVGLWGEAVTDPEAARALRADTGAHALGGDLFVDGSLGSRTAALREPYADHPHSCGTRHLGDDAVTAHLLACTRAGVPAGFHVIGDDAVGCVVDALRTVVAQLGVPAVARCGHRLEHLEMVDAAQAADLGAWGVAASVQPAFDARWGGPDGMYARRLGASRAAGLNPLALLASRGVPLALGSDAPVTGLDGWGAVRAAVAHRTAGSALSPRAAFAAATRGGWRAGGVRDGVTGTLAPGAPASYAVWDVEALEVAAPADAVARWSTDPRAGVPPLPRLTADAPAPRCRTTVHRGVTVHG